MQPHHLVERVTRILLGISSVSKMYPMAVIWMFWARDSSCISCRLWLPCHISTKLWTLANLCKFHSSASVCMSESYSVFVVSNAGSSPANITLLAWANGLTTTLSRWVSPMVYACLQPKTSWARETLASSPSPCGMIGNTSHASLPRSEYFKCAYSCWCHLSVMSGINNILLISIGYEW